MVSPPGRKPTPAEGPAGGPPWSITLPPDPPRPHRWFLVLTGVLLLSWLIFLAYLALRTT